MEEDQEVLAYYSLLEERHKMFFALFTRRAFSTLISLKRTKKFHKKNER